MSLRQRIALSLLVIAAILVAPAIYGLSALRELYGIAGELRTRDAESSLALGRMQTSLREVENSARIYQAVGTTLDEEQKRDLDAEVARGISGVDAQLSKLRRREYARPVNAATREWMLLKDALREQQRLVSAGRVAEADSLGRSAVIPAFTSLDAALDPIGAAIDRRGASDIARAAAVARRASTTTLLALAFTLGIGLLIATLLTRSLLRPIHLLQRGMATVAGGDFEPDVHIPSDRADELGDLSRSFERMTARLAELDKLKAEFVSVASHEIKTPLSVIRGFVSLLLDGIYGEISDQQRKTLESVSGQTDRLTRLVQRLLDVSRFEAGGGRLELREMDPRHLLADLASGFDVLAHQNEIGFRVEVDDDLPSTIVADPDRLNEVLGNLLSNAFKFTPKAGTITLHAERQGEGLMVEVRDSGVGIPADKLPRIFEKFFQVENEAQPRSVGSGLGLAIAREIVEAHGGTISAESEVGRGTMFRVELPAQPPAGAGHS